MLYVPVVASGVHVMVSMGRQRDVKSYTIYSNSKYYEDTVIWNTLPFLFDGGKP